MAKERVVSQDNAEGASEAVVHHMQLYSLDRCTANCYTRNGIHGDEGLSRLEVFDHASHDSLRRAMVSCTESSARVARRRGTSLPRKARVEPLPIQLLSTLNGIAVYASWKHARTSRWSGRAWRRLDSFRPCS